MRDPSFASSRRVTRARASRSRLPFDAMVHRGSLSRLARLLACLLASSSLIARARAEDFYKILGVDRGADARTLKKNYRIKALKHHPDKGGDPETFAKLSRAYETLTDPEKRRVYDEYGELLFDPPSEHVHQEVRRSLGHTDRSTPTSLPPLTRVARGVCGRGPHRSRR